MILLIDNYDSFVHNLARYFRRLGQETRVVRNDAIDVERIRELNPDAIVISPGSCGPQTAGCSLEVVRELAATVPILGVCLGHEVIAEAFGGTIGRAEVPMHGRSSEVLHDGLGIFEKLPSPLLAGRYHSLVLLPETLPDELEISAQTSDGVVMAFRHRQLPVVGVQFHPESILTERGYEILAGFLRIAGIDAPKSSRLMADEKMVRPRSRVPLPPGPVTF
jgi:anthranilate synthase/aminodeoxychorismate synthase-like glutamine amidotransferase